MWYGNFTTECVTEAERLANQLEHDKRKARIAKWVSDAAFKKAKEQLAFRKLVLEQKEYPKPLKKDTIRRRIARDL